jgi:hypothetical protein
MLPLEEFGVFPESKERATPGYKYKYKRKLFSSFWQKEMEINYFEIQS